MDIFPIHFFWPSEVRWTRDLAARSGGVGANGRQRLGRTNGGGFWICEMTVPLLRVTDIKAARAFIESQDGGVAQVLVPFFPDAEAPYPLGMPPPLVTHSDGSTFSDETMYQSGGIEVTLDQPLALRATSLVPNIVTIGDMGGGEMVSIEHDVYGEHLYCVTRLNDDGSWTLRPPTRWTAPAGTVVNGDNPRCVMSLMNAAEAMAAIKPPYIGSMMLVFHESLDPI